MKREIVCQKCDAEGHESVRKAAAAHGEFFKTKEGFAFHDLLCDHCGIGIIAKEKCYAWSIASDGAGYSEWEWNYIYD